VSLANLMRVGLVIETCTHAAMALTTVPAVALAIFFVFGVHESVWATTATTVRQLAVDLKVNANTVARVYAALERDGVFETRRGVGSFVSTTPPKPMPQRERERLLRAFATRVLADAESQGFLLEDVLGALGARRTGGR